MTHESFNAETNKIRKNFERSKENTNLLEQKRNEIIKFFTEKGKVAIIKNLLDTGFLAEAPTPNNSFVRSQKGKELSESVTFNFERNIDIPEDLVPFLDIILSVRTVPNVNAVGFLTHDIDRVGDDFVEVKGDGTLIYQGVPKPIKNIYTQEELDAGNFQESFTKNLFEATIIYIDDFSGDKFRATGIINQIKITDLLGTFGDGCVTGQPNVDIYTTEIDQTQTDFKNYAQIHSINSTTVDMTSLKEEIRANDFPDCFGSVTTEVDNVRKTHTFESAGVDAFVILMQFGILEKEVDGEFQTVATGNLIVDSLIHTILSQTFIFVGFWLFYSDDTFFFFGIDDKLPIEQEGDSTKIELKNLPQSPNRPYSTITFVRNPGDFPLFTQVEATRGGSKQETLFRLSEDPESSLTKYRLTLKDTLVLSALSSEERDPPLQIVEYNDILTQSGSGYSVNENHTFKENKKLFVSANEDVQFRVQINLKNPFYWEEVRK